MTPLVPPTIHMNGTSKEELVQQLIDAIDAARALHEAMKKAMPNGRDYYPQGDGVGKKAQAAWVERLRQVDDLMGELEEQAFRITIA